MSRWGTARWGIDRWPALSIADLLQQPPAPGVGPLIGLGDWRLVVEILLPSDETSTWGTATWGESTWSALSWRNITDHVRGLEWFRGADEVYGRPRVGELVVSLDSTDDRFDPWNPAPPDGSAAYFAPGTIIRVGVRSATDTRAGGWLPQITAIVDTWNIDYTTAEKSDRFATVTAFETVRDLAQIDDNALPGVVGGGEGAGDRIGRLLDAAAWPYGYEIEAQNVLIDPATQYPVQSTDMAANRLAECYLTADSCDAQFRSDRTGAALLTAFEYVGAIGPPDPRFVPLAEFSTINVTQSSLILYRKALNVGSLCYAPYEPQSLISGNSDDAVINDVRFARVGGTQQVSERTASIIRHGRRSLVRNDLIVTSDAVVELIAKYTSRRRALNTLRVDAATINPVDIDHPESDRIGLAVLAIDVGNRCDFVAPTTTSPPPALFTFVRSMIHRVTPRNLKQTTWQTTLALDTRTVLNLPAAQLPDTSPQT